MPTSLPNIASRVVLLFAGLALLLAGCDIVSPQRTSQVTYTVTNDLGERLTVARPNGASSVAPASAAKASTRFTLRAQVTPPDVGPGSERVSHLHHSAFFDKLYAGYMIRGDGPGNGFGGGIDILDVTNPENPDPNPSGTNVNALQVNGVDVQESTTNNHTLFVGVAEEESNDVGNTPSEVHSINLDQTTGTPKSTSGGTVDFEDRDLPGKLVKSVTRAPTTDNNYNFYAITDVNTFHRFNIMPDASIRDFATEETSSFPGVEFRGLAANEDGGWAMDDGGNIWQGIPSGGLSRRATFSTPNFFNDPGGPLLASIARVTSPSAAPRCNGTRVVFAALNNDGFRVLKTSASGATEVFRNKSLEVTSVTATHDFVYVASGSSIALFSVDHSTLCNTDTDEGLRKVGKSEVNDFGNGRAFDFSGRGQVNEIIAATIGGTDYLFIAKGEDGIFVAQQGGGSYP